MTLRTLAIPSLARNAPGLRCLSCLRVTDILVLQGSPLLGAAFALRSAVAGHAAQLGILTAANVCLVAHVFVLNDWANLHADLADPNRTSRVFTVNGVDRTEMRGLAISLLAASLLLFRLLGPATQYLALGVALFSTLYSLSWFNWKGKPLLNSAAHLGGGILHFLLGYSIGSAIDRRGLLIAVFFALIFAAGHLTQELRDHQADVLNAIRTNAVIFGRRRIFAASLVLFTLAHALLVALALQGVVPRILAALVVLYPIHLRWSLDARADNFTYASVCQLRTRYRALYALVGMAMVAALWLR
jgi:4-hydroxybenzoate polyprenyltransferase